MPCVSCGFCPLSLLLAHAQGPDPTASAAGPDTAAAAAAAQPSYNVLLTREWLMLVPRRAERHGPLALNSLAFAGTMLVRSEEELAFVRDEGPTHILACVGDPWVAGGAR